MLKFIEFVNTDGDGFIVKMENYSGAFNNETKFHYICAEKVTKKEYKRVRQLMIDYEFLFSKKDVPR